MKDVSRDNCKTNIIIERIGDLSERFERPIAADIAFRHKRFDSPRIYVDCSNRPVQSSIFGGRSIARKERRGSCHPREMLFTPLTRLVPLAGSAASRLLALRISPT